MQLSYEMTDREGNKLSVYDERTSGGTISRYVGPFETQEEAKKYCDNYVEGYGMGYNPHANPTVVEGKVYAYCTRWTSCD